MGVVSYKCPNCMAPMKHDIESQMWACEFCMTHVPADEADRLESLSDSGNQDTVVNEEYGGDAVAYSCPSCGGRIVTTPVTAATFCVYCHNPAVIASNLENEHQPNRIIPFKVKKEEAVKALQKLCAKKPLLPKIFREIARQGEVAGLYVPFWLYDVSMYAEMDALGKNITRWSDTRYDYVKTDTYAVQRAGSMEFSRIPADGSSRMDDATMDAIEPFDYSQLTKFGMQYLSGHFAESYDIDAAACSVRARGRSESAIRDTMRNTISGYSGVEVRSFTPRCTNMSHEYVMLPVWTVNVKYRGKDYFFSMNGQTGKIVGKLPLSISRIFALLGIIAAGTAALSMLVLYLLYRGGYSG